jgi:hypothetical protein
VLVILIEGFAIIDQPDQKADYDHEQDHDYGSGQNAFDPVLVTGYSLIAPHMALGL